MRREEGGGRREERSFQRIFFIQKYTEILRYKKIYQSGGKHSLSPTLEVTTVSVYSDTERYVVRRKIENQIAAISGKPVRECSFIPFNHTHSI